ALLDVDTLRRAFLLTDLACHAAQTLFPIVTVVDEEREVPRGLGQRSTLLRVLDGRQSFLRDKAPGKILRRLRQSLQNPFTQQCKLLRSSSDQSSALSTICSN